MSRSVITHDGSVLPSIAAARAYYGGVSYATIIRYAAQENPTQLRMRDDPREGVRGVRCVLPDGTQYRSVSAAARAFGCNPTALYAYVERHEGHTLYLARVPQQGRQKKNTEQ
jgi:hypothetical protein